MKARMISGMLACTLALTLGACGSSQKREEREAQETNRAAEQARAEQEREAAEARARAEANRPMNTLGRVEAEPGDAEVTTRRRVIVKSKSKIPTIRASREVADINRMEARHFEALGFSREAAQEIVRVRGERGGFRSVDDLAEIQGVNEESFDRIRPRLGVGPRAARSG